jgi:ABC-type multidrug transport system ATPase subunit
MGMSGEPVLVCRDLRKAYGRLVRGRSEPRGGSGGDGLGGELTAVDGVGFTVAEGETYGLLGPTGAGKTTTSSMIVGILARDAGEVVTASR